MNAVFTVSIDFELMWGTHDRPYAQAFHPLCAAERHEVIGRLLGLMEEYQVNATWAVVGSLFLDEQGDKEPANLYYAPDLVERIRQCKVRQEIGSHSFRHIVFEEPRCSHAEAEADVSEAMRRADEWGIPMQTFIFPRNRVGHLDVLKRHGFRCYRGPEPTWYEKLPRIVRRVGHLVDIAVAKTPPGVEVMESDGLYNVPGSMLYTPSFGKRRYVPVWLRVLRARRGLDRAVRQKQIFHLWFHPTDLVCRMDDMMDGLRRIFEYAANLREAGKLVVRPMGELIPVTTEETCTNRSARYATC